MTLEGRATDHMMKFPRPSPSVFAYCKRSETGGVKGLGTRIANCTCSCVNEYTSQLVVGEILYFRTEKCQIPRAVIGGEPE